jgi:predicted metal-binding membrane protein
MWPQVRDQRLFVGTVAGVIALTWVSLWSLGRSPYAQLAHAHGAGGHGGAWTVYLTLAGWTLMVVAMMLPTTFPLVALFNSFVRERPNRVRLTTVLIAGYLWIWTLFGFVVYAGNHLVHGAVEQSPWLTANLWMIGAGTVLLAGLYQFTTLKHKCLEKCRSPMSFIMEHWHGGQEDQEAFHLGVRHGLFCIGCCWSLMLLMVVVGIGNLAWMLMLGAIMAIEKNVSWGRRLSAPLGAFLVGVGLVLIATGASLTGGV